MLFWKKDSIVESFYAVLEEKQRSATILFLLEENSTVKNFMLFRKKNTIVECFYAVLEEKTASWIDFMLFWKKNYIVE